MKNERDRLPGQLLTADEVKKILTAEDPEYGKEFGEKDWAAIAFRLESLTRLIVQIYEQQQREKR